MAVTVDDVKGLLQTNREVAPFLGTANTLVAQLLGSAGYSTDVLDEITKYIAAHFLAVTEERGGLRYSRLDDSAESVTLDFGRGLNMTRFGQTALLLDTKGILQETVTDASTSPRARIGMF